MTEYANLPSNAEKKKRGYPDLVMYSGNQVALPQITHQDQNQLTTWYSERAVRCRWFHHLRAGRIVLYVTADGLEFVASVVQSRLERAQFTLHAPRPGRRHADRVRRRAQADPA